MTNTMKLQTLVKDVRGTATETALLLGSVALAGALGFSSLGGAMDLAIARDADGGSPGASNSQGSGEAAGLHEQGGGHPAAFSAAPTGPLSAQAAGWAEVAKLLGRFERSTVAPMEFTRRYAEDSAKALESALSPAAREYLDGEVLPILRASFADTEGSSVRYILPDDEAQIVTHIVTGDSAQATAALQTATTNYTSSLRAGVGGEMPTDIGEVVTFAPMMFEPYWTQETAVAKELGVLRKRFSRSESEELIHLRADAVGALRAREGGGEVLADFVEALLPLELERRIRNAHGRGDQGPRGMASGRSARESNCVQRGRSAHRLGRA
jgi:hypothetical protein